MSKRKKSNERTCIVCRTARSTDDLLQVSLWQGQPVAGLSSLGRHCYVCTTRCCLFSLSGRDLSRSFRSSVAIDLEKFVGDAHALATAKILATLGLARRAGVAVCGVDAVSRQPVTAGAAVAAVDLAERSKRRIAARQPVMLKSCADLGAALGRDPVGAVWVPTGHHAQAIKYWGRVVGATRPGRAESTSGELRPQV